MEEIKNILGSIRAQVTKEQQAGSPVESRVAQVAGTLKFAIKANDINGFRIALKHVNLEKAGVGLGQVIDLVNTSSDQTFKYEATKAIFDYVCANS